MKSLKPSAVPAALLLAGTLASSVCAQTLTRPSGWVTAFPKMVQTGTYPKLTWRIGYPSGIAQHVAFSNDTETSSSNQGDYITALEDLDIEIRVVGAGVTAVENGKTVEVPVEAVVSYDNESYTKVFFSTNKKVNPSKVVWSGTIRAGKRVRFGGRYKYDKVWSTPYSSDSPSNNIVTLVNGQVLPAVNPIHTSPTVQSFIKPYLDSTGKVAIGPLDTLVMMELTHTDAQASDPEYNLQDMVLLVSLKTRTDNGHGNNIDGVDSSNPGKAPFAEYDSDPTVDDEGSGGGAYPSK